MLSSLSYSRTGLQSLKSTGLNFRYPLPIQITMSQALFPAKLELMRQLQWPSKRSKVLKHKAILHFNFLCKILILVRGDFNHCSYLSNIMISQVFIINLAILLLKSFHYNFNTVKSRI